MHGSVLGCMGGDDVVVGMGEYVCGDVLVFLRGLRQVTRLFNKRSYLFCVLNSTKC